MIICGILLPPICFAGHGDIVSGFLDLRERQIADGAQ